MVARRVQQLIMLELHQYGATTVQKKRYLFEIVLSILNITLLVQNNIHYYEQCVNHYTHHYYRNITYLASADTRDSTDRTSHVDISFL